MTDESIPALGDVWRYSFLWRREADQGETEGRKTRPVAVALLIRNASGDAEVLLVPLTTVPQSGPFAMEVPEIEKKRAGLDLHTSVWIVVDEANWDTPSQSFYLEPGNRIGSFSSPFVKSVQALMIEAIKARKMRRTDRR